VLICTITLVFAATTANDPTDDAAVPLSAAAAAVILADLTAAAGTSRYSIKMSMLSYKAAHANIATLLVCCGGKAELCMPTADKRSAVCMRTPE
jgi:hypothetical protein